MNSAARSAGRLTNLVCLLRTCFCRRERAGAAPWSYSNVLRCRGAWLRCRAAPWCVPSDGSCRNAVRRGDRRTFARRRTARGLGLTLARPLLVHGRGRYSFGGPGGLALLLRASLDVFVLALSLVAPSLLWHDGLLSDRDPATWLPTHAERLRNDSYRALELGASLVGRRCLRVEALGDPSRP